MHDILLNLEPHSHFHHHAHAAATNFSGDALSNMFASEGGGALALMQANGLAMQGVKDDPSIDKYKDVVSPDVITAGKDAETTVTGDPLKPNGALREAFDSKANANGIRVVCVFFQGVGASCKEYSRDLKDPHLWNVRETFLQRFVWTTN